MRFTRQRIVGILSVMAMTGIILLVLDRLSIPPSPTQEPLVNLGEYLTQLFVGLTLLCIAAAYWGFKPDVEKRLQKLHHGIEKRDHTVELNDIIFKRLSTISIREDRHRNYGLYVKKDNTQDDPRFPNMIYAPSDHTAIPLDKLPPVYYEWALKHLEHKEYSEKILKPFKQLQDWLKQYVETETTHREKLEKQIETIVSELFKDCTIYAKTIRKRLDSEIWVDDTDNRFADLIIDKISHHDAIMPRGYPQEHPYIICETITENQLEQFKTILNNIMISEEFLHINEEQNNLLFKKIEPTLVELGSKFQRLSTELGAKGAVIEGKCKICSTF